MSNYNESSIKVFKGLDGLRARPSMYIGSVDNDGLFQIAKEIIHNSFDEIEAGNKYVGFHFDGEYVTIADMGRGIPVGKHKTSGISTLTTVFTMLHAGGKMDDGKGSYKHSVGLHGVGSSCTVALSETFQVWTYRDKAWYTQTFSRGKPTSKVQKAKLIKLPFDQKITKGTVIRYKHDTKIFGKSKLDVKRIRSMMELSAYLYPTATFEFVTKDLHKTWHKPSGLKGLVALRMKRDNVNALGESFTVNQPNLQLHLQFTDSSDEHLDSYVNGNHTTSHGSHVQGLTKAMQMIFDKYAKKKQEYRTADIFSGCYGAINVMLGAPKFTTQTKEKLNVPEAVDLVKEICFESLKKWATKNKETVLMLIERLVQLREAHDNFKANKQLASQLKSVDRGKVKLPLNLVVSSTKDPDKRELFVVEGVSAGGCFSNKTKVALSNGKNITFQNLIADAKRGIIHMGLAYDFSQKKVVTVPLKHPRLTKSVNDLVQITTRHPTTTAERLTRTSVCTPDHLWLMADETWKRAEALVPGDALMGEVEPILVSKSVRQNTLEDKIKRSEPVYDLTVDTHENFMLANGCLVHNSGKQARYHETQELLLLSGKPSNVIKNPNDINTNERVIEFLKSIGYDPANPGKYRVGKIVLLADSDVDGAHIQTLLLALIYKIDKRLFKNRVYAVDGSLFFYGDGKTRISGKSLSELRKQVKGKFDPNKVLRAKGLGEMPADLLRDMAFNPKTRRMLRITEPQGKAAYRIINQTMGEGTDYRKILLGLTNLKAQHNAAKSKLL